MARWDIDVFELGQVVFDLNLPVYDSNFNELSGGSYEQSIEIIKYLMKNQSGNEEIVNQKTFEPWKPYPFEIATNKLHELYDLMYDPGDYDESKKDELLNSLFFKMEDVMHFEDKEKNNGMESNRLPKNDARELGRLRQEKSKWDNSIKAAVLIGIFCDQLSTEGIKITKAKLQDEIHKIGFKDLPKTTIEKIWKALPEQHRKKAGRPPKEKDSNK